MDIEVFGYVAPGLESVRQVFIDNWQRIEVGASVCAYHQGKKVLDLWGGFQDRDLRRPWNKDTLVNVYSTTKGMAATVLAILFDQGKIDYQAKVTNYWPEFGAENKQNITVAQLLSHQAGLCGLDQQLKVEDLYDWDRMVRLIAAQKPLWTPGEDVGYHPITWGYLAGELVKRISGQTLGQYFQSRVAGPLGAEFYIGLADSQMDKVADLIGPNHARIQSELAPASPTAPREMSRFYNITALNPLISPFKHASSTAWRRAEIPSANGQANARGIATIYGALANKGELNGVRIIGESAIKEATIEEIGEQLDLVLQKPLRRARGFLLNTNSQFGPCTRSFGHDGTLGSLGFADPDSGLGFAYAMNQMESDTSAVPRSTLLIEALYASLSKLKTQD